MKKIDRETVSRILDAADIVEVVSDFVTLKKRGANYIGLCPFHSERTPSFSVSKAKGICKCFSCGKGGSPVNFIMELEQMSYQEALRWLAKKYNIEIKEHEETDEERRQASEREALFAVNQFALNHFEKNLYETEDGRDIGLSYFHERALNDQTIKKFHLGYALERSDTLLKDAVKNGFTEENLIKTGLCAKSERGVYDRFRGRVIYPVHSISGKIVAFGGRTLKSDKSVAKYVNSPESAIYSKSRELYGLFQARRAIVKDDKCILVEGYMDVLSMSQSGIENVVASSGTSLTSQQVNLIHRFTENVTVIYDADAAGIKASLRGVDMLLSEGMNVKVVLFPEGEDPDSYARSHTHEELAEYLKKHETDFIKFKTSVLLRDVNNDPLKRSQAIADILRSIAVIPNRITRQIYIEETSRTFGIEAKVLALEVAKGVAKIAEQTFVERQRAAAETENGPQQDEKAQSTPEGSELNASSAVEVLKSAKAINPLAKFEKALMRYLLRYGMLRFSEAVNEDETLTPINVLEYVIYELQRDEISFTDSLLAQLLEILIDKNTKWTEELPGLEEQKEILRQELTTQGLERIRHEAASISEIQKAEANLQINVEAEVDQLDTRARRLYFEKDLLSHPDDEIRRLVTDLVSDRYQLSKVHSKFTKIETEEERLIELVPRAVFELKDAILRQQIEQLNQQISEASTTGDTAAIPDLMTQLIEKMKIRSEFARYLGDRIITPK